MTAYTTGKVARAKELRARGWYWREIARALNASESTVRYWVDEKHRARCIEKAHRQYEKRKMAAKQGDCASAK